MWFLKFLFISLTLFLSGCFAIEFAPPIDTPSEFKESQKSLDSLVGSDRGEVIKLLGEPTWVIPLDDNSAHFVYQWWSEDYKWPWINFIPSPIIESHGELQPHCILLKFKDDHLTSYKVETTHHPDNCLIVFYKPDIQSLPLSMKINRNIKKPSEIADIRDIENQYNIYTDDDNKDSIKYLCCLADFGHTKAQFKTARLYWHRSDIKDNRSKSYMWYTIAATTDFSDSLYYDEKTQRSAMIEVKYKLKSVLTGEQLGKALGLISRWEPGQCEEDLVAAFSGN